MVSVWGLAFSKPLDDFVRKELLAWQRFAEGRTDGALLKMMSFVLLLVSKFWSIFSKIIVVLMLHNSNRENVEALWNYCCGNKKNMRHWGLVVVSVNFGESYLLHTKDEEDEELVISDLKELSNRHFAIWRTYMWSSFLSFFFSPF